MGWVTGFDDMIYGEDGQSPIKRTLERVLKESKSDEQRLRIEIRSKSEGTPNSRQEHVFAADPEVATADGIMRALVQRLNESPGEQFSGELRINFTAAGSSHEKYGSFTRTIRRPPSYGSPGMDTVRISLPGGFGGDNEEIDNDPESAFSANHLGALIANQQNGEPVSNEQMRQWLETAFGFTFRSMAQQMAMFERATRMMESYTLRFGMPHPHEAGIVEQRGGSDNSGGGGALGMLPMLLNAAQHLASANSGAEVVERAGSMAAGEAPPPGAARQAAINGAARLVRSLPRVGRPGPPPPPTPMGPGPMGPGPEDFDPSGGGGYFEEEADFDYPSDETSMVPYDDSEDFGGPMPGGGAPESIRDLAADDVKDLFVDWIRADPERKSQVMDMLPELTKEVM
jgi:hypothetical protein